MESFLKSRAVAFVLAALAAGGLVVLSLGGNKATGPTPERRAAQAAAAAAVDPLECPAGEMIQDVHFDGAAVGAIGFPNTPEKAVVAGARTDFPRLLEESLEATSRPDGGAVVASRNGGRVGAHFNAVRHGDGWIVVGYSACNWFFEANR